LTTPTQKQKENYNLTIMAKEQKLESPPLQVIMLYKRKKERKKTHQNDHLDAKACGSQLFTNT
jgi:uncharacterized protein YeaC (DUF1315 family)